MTSRRSILLSLVLGAFLGIFGLNSVYAQVPRSISYQGLLVKNNLPVTGTVSVDLTIYDAANTVLYKETQSTVQVTNGIFNIVLGNTNNSIGTLPPNLKFDEQYYLGVNVDGTGELAKTAFTAAPYALNSQTVGGIGVSVTPQPGMLLPLDQTGKIPKSVLPQATQTLGTIDGMAGDAGGNIKLLGANGIQITDQAPGQITIGFAGGAGTADTINVGPGLTGGGIGSKFTLNVNPNGNWITNSMIGTGVITGMKLDQFVPELGLFQDNLGNLNVGIDPSFSYYAFGTAPTNGTTPMRNIGLNLGHTNTFTAIQNFNGGLTGSNSVIGSGTFGTLGTNGTYLTVNGFAEPLAGPNGAIYEIQDNGDLRVTGSTYIAGNTYIGASTVGGTNTVGTAGQSLNTVTGATNTLTATTSNTITGGTNTVTGTTNTITGSTTNSIQSPANTIGTTQASGATNIIGTAGNSVNTITGSTNTTTGTVSNNSQAPAVNIGTSQVAGNTVSIGTAGNTTNTMNGATNTFTATISNNVQSPANNIGTTNANSANTIGNAGTSTNTVTGATNNTIGTTSNNSQAPTVNIGTSQVPGNAVNIGTLAGSTNTISGVTDAINGSTINVGAGGLNPNNNINIGSAGANSTVTITGLTASVNATTNNVGTSPAGSTNNVGNPTSTNVINGTTTFNGNTTRNGNTTLNGNITQAAPGTTASFLNTTIVGTFTQSGGNATINGGSTNVFGSVAGSNNTIGGAAGTNNIVGASNIMTATTQNSINGTTVITGNTTATGGTFTSTGNSSIGTAGTTNSFGQAGVSANTIQGATNNFNATTNNFTGDIVQLSGRSALAPTNGTTNSFGTGTTQTNNISTGNGTTTTIGNGTGNVNNIGTSVAGTSTNNIGNLTAGTTNNINGLSTFTFTGDQTYVRIAGGVASCAGLAPTAAQSELLVNGDGWFDGTVAACRLNIFGASGSCITNLNTTNLGSCGGAGVPINLIASVIGVPSGAGSTDITNIRTIQASTTVQTNNTLTIGTTGTNATNITSSNPGPAAINQQTPTVSGKLPTFQTYILPLVPGAGPNGGGAVTVNAATAPGLNFDNNDALLVTYRSHNIGVAAGDLWVTSIIPGVSFVVESSSPTDNNTVTVTILRD